MNIFKIIIISIFSVLFLISVPVSYYLYNENIANKKKESISLSSACPGIVVIVYKTDFFGGGITVTCSFQNVVGLKKSSNKRNST